MVFRKGPPIGTGRSAEVFAWGEGNTEVLKLFYRSDALDTARTEAETTTLVYQKGLPVPRVSKLVEVDGRPGIVMERISGISMLTLLKKKPYNLFSYSRTLADLQAQMHETHVPSLPSQNKFLTDYINRAELTEEERTPILALLDELGKDQSQSDRLCHGDYHPDNVVVTNHGPVILDWVIATRGNPLADFARTSLILALGDPPPGTPLFDRILITTGRNAFNKTFSKRYRKRRPVDEDQFLRWQLPDTAARLGQDLAAERAELQRRTTAMLAGGLT